VDLRKREGAGASGHTLRLPIVEMKLAAFSITVGPRWRGKEAANTAPAPNTIRIAPRTNNRIRTPFIAAAWHSIAVREIGYGCA